MDIIRNLKSTLCASGLSEAEINFYIEALKKPRTVYALAKATGLQKDKAYKISESLRDKKLLELKKGLLRACSLENFIENLLKEGRKYYKTADKLKEVRPFIKYLNESIHPGEIEVFSDDKLAEHFLDIVYLPGDRVLSYGNFEVMLPQIHENTDQTFVKKRVKSGRRAHVILKPGPYTNTKVKPNDIREMRQTQFLEAEELNNFLVLAVEGSDKVSIWERDPKTEMISAVFVESPILANLHKRTHQILGQRAAISEK